RRGQPCYTTAATYSYDNGNVTAISDNKSSANNQSYSYEHRDRPTSWTLGAATPQSYSYNEIGNLTSKAGTSYTFPAAGAARPLTPSSVRGTSYAYDANGNLMGGSG
ncbi:MAG TPA: hypothetical protein VFO07_16675, partial [Roseiflexaceae bacterium]|nr:hypothetical protein [Roseiflexaceae bacterium]